MAVNRTVASATASNIAENPYTIENQKMDCAGMDNPNSAGMLSGSLFLGACIGDIHDRLLTSLSRRTVAEEVSEKFVREKPRFTKTRVLNPCEGLARRCSNARSSEETIHKRSGSPVWTTRTPILSFKAVRANQYPISYVLIRIAWLKTLALRMMLSQIAIPRNQ